MHSKKGRKRTQIKSSSKEGHYNTSSGIWRPNNRYEVLATESEEESDDNDATNEDDEKEQNFHPRAIDPLAIEPLDEEKDEDEE